MEMSEQDFARHALAYGAALERWPDAVRAQAAAFLRQHPQTARRILQPESDVDAALALAPVQKVHTALEERILRDFDQVMRTRKASARRPAAWLSLLASLMPDRAGPAPALGLLMALLLIFGFMGGYAGYASALDKASSSEILAMAFGNGDSIAGLEDASS